LANDSKQEKVIEKMEATPEIDVNVEIKIPRSASLYDESKHKYKCSCCGKGFARQNGYFQKSNDVLFQANNGYLPWCKECTDKYVTQMTALYSNNEELAMKDFCQRAGWNYDLTALVASRETYSGHRDRSRISHYSAKKNLNCGGRKTYTDTLKYDYENKQNEVVTSKEQAEENGISVTNAAIDRWGTGLNEWDYSTLESHYRWLKKVNPNTDNNQEIFIKSLCNLHWLQAKLLRNENCDTSKYATLVEQYSKTFKQAGLRTIEEKDNSNDECLGVTLREISQYTPEEYYKDKSLYKDFDNVGDYFDRFVKRPLKNLMFGTNERDKEFYVKEENDIDE